MNMKINGFWELLYIATEEEKETIITYMGEGIMKERDDEKKRIYSERKTGIQLKNITIEMFICFFGG